MKKLVLFTLAVFLLAGCADEDEDADLVDRTLSGVQKIVTQITESVEKTLSKEKHGYGQGVITDDDNRPVGAVDFNDKFGKYDAYALNDGSDITLTFDEGYENGYTEKILDTLKEKKVSAVFFITGDYAEKNPELVKRMIAEGHTVGNHTMNHYSMPDLTAEEIKDELMQLHDYVKKHFAYEMTLMRPPMGEFSEFSLSQTKALGYKTVMWSFAYKDWLTDEQPDPATSKQKLIDAAHEGAVYLLHPVSSTNAEILGDVIDAIRAKGFKV